MNTTRKPRLGANFAADLLRWSARIMLIGFLGTSLMALAVLIVLPRATDGAALSVLTGSMTPKIPVGSVVLIRPVDTASLEVGDIATYQKSPDKQELITHRVIDVETTPAGTSFVFKGDANQKRDLNPVPAEAIRGKVWFHLPYLGSIRDAFQGIAGVGLLAILLLGGYALTQFAGAFKERRRKHVPGPDPAIDSGGGIVSDRPLVVARIPLDELAGIEPAQAAAQFGGILVAQDGDTCTVMVAESAELLSHTLELIHLFNPVAVSIHEPPHRIAVQLETTDSRLEERSETSPEGVGARRRVRLVGGALVTAAILTTGAGSQPTYARFSDFASVPAEARAGVWAPDPQIPTECGALKNYKGIVTGTEGDDDLDAGNGKQIVFGLGGDDVIRGGNGKDCLAGDDGDDLLIGANAKDVMIGGDGDDTCRGGHAPDTYGCEHQDEFAEAAKRKATESSGGDEVLSDAAGGGTEQPAAKTDPQPTPESTAPDPQPEGTKGDIPDTEPAASGESATPGQPTETSGAQADSGPATAPKETASTDADSLLPES